MQVRRAVELLVGAMGRWDVRQRERGEPGLTDVDAHEVYRGSVSVMMLVVLLLFAEERGLLPADNDGAGDRNAHVAADCVLLIASQGSVAADNGDDFARRGRFTDPDGEDRHGVASVLACEVR